MSNAIEVTDSDFETQVLKAPGPVLVDFWAPWCGPCRRLAPILDELAAEYNGKLTFAKLNCQDYSFTPSNLGVRSIPTVIIFKGGKEVSRIVGLGSKADLKQKIEAAIS